MDPRKFIMNGICQCAYHQRCANPEHFLTVIDLRSDVHRADCKRVYAAWKLHGHGKKAAVDHIIELWEVKRGESSSRVICAIFR
jgi:hypothetical protein